MEKFSARTTGPTTTGPYPTVATEFDFPLLLALVCADSLPTAGPGSRYRYGASVFQSPAMGECLPSSAQLQCRIPASVHVCTHGAPGNFCRRGSRNPAQQLAFNNGRVLATTLNSLTATSDASPDVFTWTHLIPFDTLNTLPLARATAAQARPLQPAFVLDVGKSPAQCIASPSEA